MKDVIARVISFEAQPPILDIPEMLSQYQNITPLTITLFITQQNILSKIYVGTTF